MGLVQRIKLAARERVSPKPEQTTIVSLSTALAAPRRGYARLTLSSAVVTELSVSPPRDTPVTKNLCLAAPDQRQLEVDLLQSDLEDLTRAIVPETTVLSENLCPTSPGQYQLEFGIATRPDIESMFDLLMGQGQRGKSYDGKPAKKAREPVDPDDLKTCKHGLIKATCEICAEEKKRRSNVEGKLRPRIVNVFDLLLPYLYPPLGTNFDNAIVFPPGKDLFGFQREGVRFLATREAALLADEMGLGKSIQAIVATRLLIRSGNHPMATLILCPKSVLKDWQIKLDEWAPELSTLPISGSAELRGALWQTPAHVHLANYDILRRDRHFVTNGGYDIVILDEIQSIKNPGSQRTQAVRRINGHRRWGLSATPMENKVEDLVSVFAYLKPGILKVEDAKTPSTVKHKIKPYFLRRKVESVKSEIGLGDKMSRVVWLELTPEQKQTYERLIRSARQSLQPDSRRLERLAYSRNRSARDESAWRTANIEIRGKALASIGKLKQVCNFDPVTRQSCKADFIMDKLTDLRETDDKALIFSQYPNISLRPLADRLRAFRPETFDGALSMNERARLIQEFQEKDDTQVMLMSLKAGGLGITLTRANHVFHLDHWWNPAVAAQAVGRVYRVGQEKPVFVNSLYVSDTIEERIFEKLKLKHEIFRQVIDDLSDERIVSTLSTEELLELFDLVRFSVWLVNPGEELGKAIKAVSEIAQLEDSKARKQVRTFPSAILQNVPSEQAERAKARLEAAGAKAEIRSVFDDGTRR